MSLPNDSAQLEDEVMNVLNGQGSVGNESFIDLSAELMGTKKKEDNNGLAVAAGDMGKADTIRYNVVNYIVEEKYDKAIKLLNYFIDRESEYPNFKTRLHRYVKHCIDLINAMKAKKNFPGMNSLTRSKQQELQDRVIGHFNELQHILKKIEDVQRDLKIQDVKSTIWVIRVSILAVAIIVACGFLVDVIKGGVGETALMVLDDGYTQIFLYISKFI